VKGFSGTEPMVVGWAGRMVDLQNNGADGIGPTTVEISLSIDGMKFRSCVEQGQLMLVSEDNQSKIALTFKNEKAQGGLTFVTYFFEYKIPQSEGFPPDTEVPVVIADECFVPAQVDDNYFVRLRWPTRNLTVTCAFPEGVITTAYAFGFTPRIREPLLQGGNVATVCLDEWCLPGHGVFITWHLPANWGNKESEGRIGSEAGTSKWLDGAKLG